MPAANSLFIACFLLFVPVDDVVPLDMSVEEAAKLVISAGLVAPEFGEARDKALAKRKSKKEAKTLSSSQ